MRQFFKYFWLGIVFILLLALLLAPVFAKRYVNKNGEALSGRKLHIEKLRINYFTSTLKVIDFAMFEKNGQDEFVGFDTLLVNLKPLRLLKHELYLQQFLLANLRGNAIRNDSLFNFSDLMTASSTDTVPENPENDTKETKKPLHLNLHNLEMRNGNFSFVDKPVNNAVHMHSLSFAIPHIYWNAADSSKADLAFQLSEGGTFVSDVNYDVASGDFNGLIQIDGLALNMLLPYARQFMRFANLSGTYKTNLTFAGNAGQLNALAVKGYMAVDSLLLLDINGDSIAGMQQAWVALQDVRPMQNHFAIDSIHIAKPFCAFVLVDSLQTNWSQLLVDAEATPADTLSAVATNGSDADTIAPKQEAPRVQVNRLHVEGGRFVYKDLQLDTPFVFTIRDFDLRSDSVVLGGNQLAVRTKMTMNKSAQFESKLKVNPNAVLGQFAMDYVVSGLLLSDFDAYTRKYIGYSVSEGSLYLIGNAHINDSILKSENDLNIRSIAMGDKEGGEYDVPVKTALFLLKDNHNNVHLDLPIEGDLSDPNTSLGGLVAKKLTDFVFKIIKSPFKFMGSIVGLEAGEMSNIPFDYQETRRLYDGQKKSLDAVIKYAEKNRDLKVELLYLNDKDLERRVLAAELAEADFEKQEKKKASSNADAYVQFLTEQSNKKGATKAQMELAYVAPEKLDKEVDQREKQRLKMVRDYLKKYDKEGLVTLYEYDASNPSNKESTPRLLARIGLGGAENKN